MHAREPVPRREVSGLLFHQRLQKLPLFAPLCPSFPLDARPSRLALSRDSVWRCTARALCVHIDALDRVLLNPVASMRSMTLSYDASPLVGLVLRPLRRTGREVDRER